MENVFEFISISFAIVISLFLIFKPNPFIKFIGNIYWHMGKFTALGKSEETKKYFIGKNTFWFRTWGVIMLMIVCLSIVARLAE